MRPGSYPPLWVSHWHHLPEALLQARPRAIRANFWDNPEGEDRAFLGFALGRRV